MVIVLVRSSRSKDAKNRLGRLRVLSDELDKQRSIVAQRGQSIETKAGFLVVASGLIATGYLAVPVVLLIGKGATGAPKPFGIVSAVDLLPLLTSLAAVVMATVAMWPRRTSVLSAQSLVSKWIDACQSPEDLEDYLLETKTREIESRDKRTEKQATALKWGFYLTAASVFLVAASTLIDRLT